MTEGDGYDYVTRTSQNQGILQSTGFVNHENVNDAGIWSLGLLQMDFFYRNKPWYAGQFVRKVIPLMPMTRHYVLYFQTLLNKLKPKLLSGLVRDVDDNFLSSQFLLPMKNNEIDFQFIENYIKALEAERIETLEAYLTVTGLKDYHLTEKDEQILDRFAKLSDTESRVEESGAFWQFYNLEKSYGKSTRGKRLKSADRLFGRLPFVTAGEEHTGISAYIGNDVEVFKPHTITIDMFGSAKYRGYEYGADDHVAVVHTEHLNRYSSMFVSTSIHKVANSGQFSYSRNFYAKDADLLDISLPTFNNQPDYDFMSDFIRAVEKLVIKDLVEWTDKKIAATKEIVGQNNKI